MEFFSNDFSNVSVFKLRYAAQKFHIDKHFIACSKLNKTSHISYIESIFLNVMLANIVHGTADQFIYAIQSVRLAQIVCHLCRTRTQ